MLNHPQNYKTKMPIIEAKDVSWKISTTISLGTEEINVNRRFYQLDL